MFLIQNNGDPEDIRKLLHIVATGVKDSYSQITGFFNSEAMGNNVNLDLDKGDHGTTSARTPVELETSPLPNLDCVSRGAIASNTTTAITIPDSPEHQEGKQPTEPSSPLPTDQDILAVTILDVPESIYIPVGSSPSIFTVSSSSTSPSSTSVGAGNEEQWPASPAVKREVPRLEDTPSP